MTGDKAEFENTSDYWQSRIPARERHLYVRGVERDRWLGSSISPSTTYRAPARQSEDIAAALDAISGSPGTLQRR